VHPTFGFALPLQWFFGSLHPQVSCLEIILALGKCPTLGSRRHKVLDVDHEVHNPAGEAPSPTT